MAFSNEQVTAIQKLHHHIVTKYRYQTDQERWGVIEFWHGDRGTPGVPGLSGKAAQYLDCDDYAIQFMLECMRLGLNARLVIVLYDGTQGHCICEVASKDLDEAFYLDNNFRTIATRDQYRNYEFIAVSPWNPRAGETRPWTMVDRRDRIVR